MAIAPSPISVLTRTPADGQRPSVRVCIDLLQEIDDLAVLVARAPRRGFVFRGAGGQIRGGRAGGRARGGRAGTQHAYARARSMRCSTAVGSSSSRARSSPRQLAVDDHGVSRSESLFALVELS